MCTIYSVGSMEMVATRDDYDDDYYYDNDDDDNDDN